MAVSQGTASSCAARARLSVATKEDQVREDRGGSVMGATWLADFDRNYGGPDGASLNHILPRTERGTRSGGA